MVIRDIETGVDKLVSLIAKRQRIDLNVAADELGVSESVLREWAEFLSEEGLINIDYGLSKVTLSEKKITQKEAEGKIKEYHSKKDAFVNKVETTLKTLERETEEFDLIKQEFGNLKKNIGTEMEDVKRELEELQHYEDLKLNIDNDIKRQKEEYAELIEKARREISFEESKYTSLLDNVTKEKDNLVNEKKEILQLEEKEDHLRKRLEAIYEIIKTIDKKIEGEKSYIENAEDHLADLQKLADKVEKDIMDKKKNIIEPLIRKSEEQTEKISIVQDSILQKIKDKETKLDKYSVKSKEISNQFKKFFDKKMRTENLMGKIDDDKLALETQLKELIKKAHAFNAMAKKTDVKDYISQLMKTYDQIESRKGLLRTKMEQLVKLVKGD